MGAIQELERDALDPKISVSTLLQRALSLAVKLNLLDTAYWIEKELNGYNKEDKIPEYRITRGSLQAWDRSSGWIPARFRKSQREAARIVETIPMGQPMAQIEVLMSKDDGTSLATQLGDEPVLELRRAFKIETDFRVAMPPGTLQKTADGVRTQLVKWLATLQHNNVNADEPVAKEQPASNVAPQRGMVFNGPVHNPIFQMATSSANQTATSSAGAPSVVVSKGGWLSELWSKIVNTIPEKWILIALGFIFSVGSAVYAWAKGWIQTWF